MGKSKDSKTKKESKQELHISLSEVIDGKHPQRVEDVFPDTFHLVNVGEEQLILKQITDDGIVIVSNREAMAFRVMAYASNRPWYGITNKKDALTVVDWWASKTEAVDMPPPFRWLDEYGLSFSRLPWPKGVTGPKPTWDGVGLRMSNSRPFREAIGSLFDKDVKHQQYVWCYGGGGNGKSAIDRVLQRIFGPAYASAFPPKDRVGFWLYSLLGKRLVVFPDCGDKNFPATGTFKSMCANDAMPLEKKNGATYSMKLNCSYMFLSNELPNLSSEDADSRRVIFCELGKPNPEERRPTFEDDLWNEAGSFITQCISEWEAGGKVSGVISTDNSEISSHVEDNEMEFESFTSHYFDIKIGAKISGLAPTILQDYMRLEWKKRYEWNEYRRWLERRHGVYKKQVTSGEDRNKYVYHGLFLKPGVVVGTQRYPLTVDGKKTPYYGDVDE